MTIRAKVDEDLCIGSGNCVHLAPGAFELDDAELAHVVDGHQATDEQLRLAARSCPTSAILLEEDE